MGGQKQKQKQGSYNDVMLRIRVTGLGGAESRCIVLPNITITWLKVCRQVREMSARDECVCAGDGGPCLAGGKAPRGERRPVQLSASVTFASQASGVPGRRLPSFARMVSSFASMSDILYLISMTSLPTSMTS